MKKKIWSNILIVLLICLVFIGQGNLVQAFDLSNSDEIKLSQTSIAININIKKPIYLLFNSENMSVLEEFAAEYERDAIWETSNASVAKYEDGYIVPVGAGKCTIKVTYRGKSYECSVEVSAEDGYYLEIFPSAIKLYVGNLYNSSIRVSLNGSGLSTVEMKNVIWRSTDPSIATVSEYGYPSAVSQGTCQIIATYKGLTASCNVTVIDERENSDTDAEITISESSIQAAAGDLRELYLKRYGEKIGEYDEDELLLIKWSSDNKDVATVDKYGQLITRRPGTCTITAKFEGSKYECKVTVSETKFSIVNKNISLNYGARKEVKFKSSPEQYYIFPEYYSTSNKNVAIFDFDENEVIAKGKGTCTITFTFYNGQELSCTVKVGTPTFKQQLESLASYAIDDLSITYNSNSAEYLADIYIHNTTKKKITYVDFAIFQYDNKGDRIYKNDSDFIYNGNIAAKDFEIVNCTVGSGTKKVHACVKKVYYSDGTTWKNPLYTKWTAKYKNKF